MNNTFLRFPDELRRTRIRRGLLQKTFAHQLQMDPGQLCAVERGSRGPLDASTLHRAADLLELSDLERRELIWAAHHDRLVTLLVQRGACLEEIELVSASLEAWHHLHADQRQGLVLNVRKCIDSAKLLTSLSTLSMQPQLCHAPQEPPGKAAAPPRSARQGAKAPGGLEMAGSAGVPQGPSATARASEWASRSRAAGSPK